MTLPLEIEEPGPAPDEPSGRMRTNYLTTQNPCASMPSATLNLLRKFSSATAAVSSTICASEKCARTRAKSSSPTFWPVMVIASAYVERRLLALVEERAGRGRGDLARSSSSVAPACIPRDALMSIQNGQPLIRATRR